MYIGNVIASTVSLVCIIFTIICLGYLIGNIKIKGISLGSAGVLLVALIFGIIAKNNPEICIGSQTITLFDADIKSKYSLISSIGTCLFVTSIGFIAGPKFFRTFNSKTISYIYIGIIVILVGSLCTLLFIKLDSNLTPSFAAGLMTGALTSTPGLSAAKEVLNGNADLTTAGYGIAYLFGVLGVVLFVQIVPKLLKVDMELERKNFIAANVVNGAKPEGNYKKLDSFGFFPFFFAIVLGCFIGSFYIPGINFSLGNSGGCLIAGLIIGHFGHIGKIDCSVNSNTIKAMRELGLILFLVGAGVPGGVNFANNIKLSYFIYGVIITLVPMIVGYIVATKLFKMNLFNALGSITGGMTSTPALGALIQTTGTDDVASAYAASYPIALVTVVIVVKLIVMFS
ncbi:MAG: YidE/YbjL duplication [Firmicutes bacterium]|nr:YidE/YbjL duplication [Candidatus Colivicinus equi]